MTQTSYGVRRADPGEFEFTLSGDYLVSWSVATTGTGPVTLTLEGDEFGPFTNTAISFDAAAGTNLQSAQHIISVEAGEDIYLTRTGTVNLANGTFTAVRIGPAVIEPSGSTQRVSIHSDGSQGDGDSSGPSTSGDGRLVAFSSEATNLVTGDTNGDSDIFVRDLQSGLTTRVSVDSNGFEGNGKSNSPSISADGRFVAFSSNATNLVPGDTNGKIDIFVHDRHLGTTTLVSTHSDGTQASDHASSPSISADGLFVAFSSNATNLVAGDTNGFIDIFVRDLQNGLTTRVSVHSDGTQGRNNSFAPSISADGRFVAFSSAAGNLVAGDFNTSFDIFVHDRQNGLTTRVSVHSDGTEGTDSSRNPSISADGRFVAFSSDADNLVAGDVNSSEDIFVRDRQSGTTTLVSVDDNGVLGNGDSKNPSISADGRFVAFDSEGSDVLIRDLQTSTTVGVAIDNSRSWQPSLSADGKFVAFTSSAFNLVAGDTNGLDDIFVTTNSLLP